MLASWSCAGPAGDPPAGSPGALPGCVLFHFLWSTGQIAGPRRSRPATASTRRVRAGVPRWRIS